MTNLLIFCLGGLFGFVVAAFFMALPAEEDDWDEFD